MRLSSKFLKTALVGSACLASAGMLWPAAAQDNSPLAQFHAGALALVQCVQEDAGAASCSDAAETLSGHLADIETGEFEFHAAGVLDTFLYRDILVLNAVECDRSQVEDRFVGVGAWSGDSEYAQYHSLNEQGQFIDDSCLIAVKLPFAELDRLAITLVDESKTEGELLLDQSF